MAEHQRPGVVQKKAEPAGTRPDQLAERPTLQDGLIGHNQVNQCSAL